MTQPDSPDQDPQRWWYSWRAERDRWTGPFDTRDEALAAARTINGRMIVYLRHAELLDVSTLEVYMSDIFQMLDRRYPDSPFFSEHDIDEDADDLEDRLDLRYSEVTDEAGEELAASVTMLLRNWLVQHEINPVIWHLVPGFETVEAEPYTPRQGPGPTYQVLSVPSI